MMKKIVVYVVFMLAMLMMVPAASSYGVVTDQHALFDRSVDTQQVEVQETAAPAGFSGFLLIHVMMYSLDDGLHPCEGANISVRGLFHSYKGQTDENGTCLFQVHTHLFRTKRYFVQVTIEPKDWKHIRFASIYMEPWEILYREFLFLEL
ncbi:MAG: hypothetical protein JXA75_06790 [Candidatus Thermoplasmatota archaeon]|nr:hypothetical protein [Candidatus Thermoplasmatota archaeon]